MAERDSACVAAACLAHHFYRGEFALDFVVVFDALFNRAVDVCDSCNFLHTNLKSRSIDIVILDGREGIQDWIPSLRSRMTA